MDEIYRGRCKWYLPVYIYVSSSPGGAQSTRENRRENLPFHYGVRRNAFDGILLVLGKIKERSLHAYIKGLFLMIYT